MDTIRSLIISLACLMPAAAQCTAQEGISVTVINHTVLSVSAYHTPGSGAEVLVITKIRHNNIVELCNINPRTLYFGRSFHAPRPHRHICQTCNCRMPSDCNELEPLININHNIELHRNGCLIATVPLNSVPLNKALPTLQDGDVLHIVYIR